MSDEEIFSPNVGRLNYSYSTFGGEDVDDLKANTRLFLSE